MNRPAEPPTSLPPTLDPTILGTAIASLSPALEILERFHHRNKNQHRLSKWWAQADMLRRHVRKMLVELENGVVEAERVARVRLKQSKRKGMMAREEEGADENGVVRARAEYLRWKLGPGSYLALTQLAADKQFAHLGLMLLGVLAQVDKAIAPFAPAPTGEVGVESEEEPAPPTSQTPRSFGTTKEPSANIDQDTDTDMDMDMGVPVSRDEILMSTEQDATATSASTPIPATSTSTVPAATQRAISLPLNPATSKKRKPSSQNRALQQLANQEPLPSKESSPTPAVTNQPPKKKNKKKKGDEFDDIFGSLGDSRDKTRKKTKRKKGGDEFDDIFGGL